MSSGDPATSHGLPFHEVHIRGELGDFPAWLVPPQGPGRHTQDAPATGNTQGPDTGDRTTWVVAIHGRGSSPEDALGILPTLATLGLTTLAVTYRNDSDAPASPDGQNHLGTAEWQDVAAAIQFAHDHGARDVVLLGWSLGGAIALNTLRHAAEAEHVRAVILDSPVIDWATTIHMHARTRKMPPLVAWATIQLVERRLRARLTTLDQRRYASDLQVPILVFADRDDEMVPPDPTAEYAALRPDLITIVETSGAGHCRSWNQNPERYAAHLAGFLTDLGLDGPPRVEGLATLTG